MLVDTSVLIRTLQPHHPLYTPADRALRLLPEQGRELHIVAQNLIELWMAEFPFRGGESICQIVAPSIDPKTLRLSPSSLLSSVKK
jgi:hypothetical protein